MPSNETARFTASDTQKLSDRTVFRFQQIANLLKKDLASLSAFKGTLGSVLFVQRDWKHTKADEKASVIRYYNANLCATFSLAGTVHQELLSAVTSKSEADGSVTTQQLKDLFAAHQHVSKEANAFVAFGNAIQTKTTADQEHAHRLLVEAASAIPYRGQLPTAFDGLLGQNPKLPIGYWFTGAKTSDNAKMQFSYLELRRLRAASPAKLKKLRWGKMIEEITLTHENPDLTQHEATLRVLFENFLDPLLLGDPNYAFAPPSFSKPSKMKGLAFPCFERTQDDHYSGAFLGWLFFIFSTKPSFTGLSRSWDSFRFAVNHFADRILEATIDEVLGEYGEKAKRGNARSPDEEFRDYLPRVEGWLEDKRGSGISLILPQIDGSPFETKIIPKGDTLHTEAELSLALLLRCHRLHRGLTFVHDNSRVESLKKYQQMMTLLERPLSSISNALAEVQSSTQELRAVLYEPAKALFESYSSLADLFTEQKKLRASKHVEVPLSHNGVYRGETGKVVLAVALCRIFGREKQLEEQRTSHGIIDHAKLILRECEIDGKASFHDLVKDLVWLLNVNSLPTGEGLLPTVLNGEPDAPLQTIKQILFAPFKLHTKTWNLRAIVLAIRSGGMRDGLKHDTLPAEWQIDERFFPCSYHTLLAFLADVAAHTNGNQQCGERLNEISCPSSNEPDTWVLRLSFDKPWFDRSKVGSLRNIIHDHVLGSPRDWRVFSTNTGDFRKPFVDLASRLLGVSGKGHGGWERVMPAVTRDSYGIIAVKHPTERRSFTISATLAAGDYTVMEIAWLPTNQRKRKPVTTSAEVKLHQ